MNVENMRKLITHLKSLPDEQFDMSVWRTTKRCGTVACIAGWAAELCETEAGFRSISTEYTAKTWLGLNWGVAGYLFNGLDPVWDEDTDIDKVTPPQAIEKLEELLAAYERDSIVKPDLILGDVCPSHFRPLPKPPEDA